MEKITCGGILSTSNKSGKGGQITTSEESKEGFESRMMYRSLTLVIELIRDIIALKKNYVVTYTKKAERQIIDAFELWCWIRLFFFFFFFFLEKTCSACFS